MLEIFGWIGSLLFALCGLPQAIKCFKEKNAYGVSSGFILMWFLGEIFTILYVFPKHDIPLLFNYFINLLFLSIITWYKFFPKK